MKYFGTDGIRGKAGEFLTYELAFRVGTALFELHDPAVVIGRDTRESGPMLVKGIADGAKSVGIDVCDLGIVSTPLLSHISGVTQSIGVMITASHNPFEDNGIKVFRLGKKLFAGEEQALEDVLNGLKVPVSPTRKGLDLPSFDAFRMYAELFKGFVVTTHLKIALDLANGGTYSIGPSIFRTIAPHLALTGNHPNGKNINEGVGSTHLDNLIGFVSGHGSDYGFAFDGDGDRLLAVDKNGKVYDGDMLIYVIADYLNSRNLLKESAVVLTKMSNLGIIKAFEKKHISVLLADVGDKYVLEMLENRNLTIGGENSGHIINRRLLNTGDGVLNAAYLVKILEETGQSLAELTKDLVFYPDKMVNLKNVDKTLVGNSEVTTLVDAWRKRLGDEGKIIVRASGTEPLIRVSVSAKSMEILDECQKQIVDLIERLNQKK